MAGNYVRDANAPDLLSGATLNSATSSTGTAWEALHPMDLTLKLETGSGTAGTNPTITIDIEGSATSAFSTKVVLGRMGIVTGNAASQQSVTHTLKLSDVRWKYIRANVTTGGTSPDYSGTTLKPVLVHERENPTTDKAVTRA